MVATPDDSLMSQSVPGSQNVHTRRQYVHRPEEGVSGVETSLWWSHSEDDPEDRILLQMLHVPRNYLNDRQRLMTIYMPGGLGNEPEGQEKFVTEKCPVSHCRLTSDRAVASTAEMRLLQVEM